jgi:beta-N-acetylhexosaminidase
MPEAVAGPPSPGPRPAAHDATSRALASNYEPRTTNHAFLVCGIPGTALDADERRLLGEVRPGGVILFARNVGGREELAELVREVRALPFAPYVSIDMEGGRVNRLARLLGPLPSPAAAAAAGADAVEALGAAIGAACAHFGIGVDFAPAVDIGRPEGWVRTEGRCFACHVDGVVAAGSAFLGGLERYGVAGCLKHYPGLGSGAVDSHKDLPLLDDGAAVDERAFLELMRPGRAVMVAHAVAPSLGEPALPASLSAAVIGRLRGGACGPVLSDDLEMGALAAFGSFAERAGACLLAGCDQAVVSNTMSARLGVVEWVLRWSARDPVLAARLRAARRRTVGWGCGELADVEWGEVERLAERARTLAGVTT